MDLDVLLASLPILLFIPKPPKCPLPSHFSVQKIFWFLQRCLILQYLEWNQILSHSKLLPAHRTVGSLSMLNPSTALINLQSICEL